MNKKALSLLEIIVSTVILALVMTGLVNVFIAGKRYIQHSRYRIGGGEVGKKFLDPLQAYVRQDTWSSNCFGTDNISNCAGVSTTNSPYSAVYAISTHPSATNIKKVKTTISWAE